MKNFTIISILFSFLGLTGCNQDCSMSTNSTSSGPNQNSANQSCATGNSSTSTPVASPTPTPIATATPTPTPTATPSPSASYYPLLWESVRPESKAWSSYLLNLVQTELASQLMPGADDMDMFCPKYDRLDNAQRANVWGLLISAVVKFESDFDPTSRMKETTMGTDPVTGQHVYSEGLMQLSYQDKEWAPYCEFDWSKDKNLAATDPNKTILDPKINLYCGTRILADQVKKLGVIAADKNHAYWAVLIPDGKYTELDNIIALTKKMPGCQ